MTQSGSIKIELYGVPRLRAGIAEFEISVPALPCPLGDLFSQIRLDYPSLADELFDNEFFDDEQLRPEFIVNVSGRRFTRSKEDTIKVSDSILIMSSDAGG